MTRHLRFQAVASLSPSSLPWLSLLVFLFSALGLGFSPAYAEPKNFICKSSKWADSPSALPYVAVAIMRSGAERPLVPILKRDKWTEERCRKVVDGLNSATHSGQIRYLTWGRDGAGTISLCAVSHLGAMCQSFIYPLTGDNDGNRYITELGKPNQDAIRFRDGRAYLSVSMVLDPNGSECGDGFELKDEVCQKKPDPPCPDGQGRGSDGQCICPPGKIKNESGDCAAPVTITCGPGTTLGFDGKSCVVIPPNPGGGGGIVTPTPYPQPIHLKCPPGLAAFLCDIFLRQK